MGRTVPSFRIALIQEESQWKPFRDTLDTESRLGFDRLFLMARLYISACTMCCKPVRIYTIIIAMIFHHYKQLVTILERVLRNDPSS